jgi:hypothetical protein
MTGKVPNKSPLLWSLVVRKMAWALLSLRKHTVLA